MTARLLARRPLRAAGLFLAFAVAAGCGGSTAEVSGTVTYKGKPVTSGSVGFYAGTEAAPVVTEIGADGRYTARGVGVGQVKVTVYSPNPKAEAAEIRSHAKDREGGGAPPPPSADALKAWFPIPDKYADPTKTDLTATLKGGVNTFDVDIK